MRYIVAKINGEPMFAAPVREESVSVEEQLLNAIFGVSIDPWYDWAVNGTPLWEEE